MKRIRALEAEFVEAQSRISSLVEANSKLRMDLIVLQSGRGSLISRFFGSRAGRTGQHG